MTKTETLDCVAVKRRAQRSLAKALAGKSPEEQTEMLQRLAARAPLWKSLLKSSPERVRKTAATRRQQRSAG
jgi:hypothetical protein